MTPARNTRITPRRPDDIPILVDVPPAFTTTTPTTTPSPTTTAPPMPTFADLRDAARKMEQPLTEFGQSLVRVCNGEVQKEDAT